MKNRSRDMSDKRISFFYRCEGCLKKFSLPTDKLSHNPYPRQEFSPVEEVSILCLRCRKDMDAKFKELVDGQSS